MKDLHYQLTLRLYLKEKSFGPGPMRLLQGVLETGSLHKSASNMGMAYSKAWKMIRSLEEEWGFPLLEKHSGGFGGGGSTLTAEGKELLDKYTAMLTEIETFTQTAFEKHFSSEQ